MEIIPEIGLNHCGDVERARTMLSAVLDAGIRKLTFQVREPAYYDGSLPWQRPLPFSFYEEAIATARARASELGFAVCDPETVTKLDLAGAAFFKSLSWGLTNEGLQSALVATRKMTWVSTGVSGIEEIRARACDRENVGFIHTQISNGIDDQNVRAIETIRDATAKPVAFGLHCAEHRVLLLSLAMRPDALFFYVRDRVDEPVADDAHAIPLSKLRDTIQDLELLRRAVGTGAKLAMEIRI